MKNAAQMTCFTRPGTHFWNLKKVIDPIKIDWISDDVVALENKETDLESLLRTLSILRVYYSSEVV